MSRNRIIGREGRIPWHLSEDFKWFKRCTAGQVVLMGRKTYDSLGRPLPNRTNIVLTRGAPIEGVEIIRDIETFDPSVYLPRETWVIGGAEIYGQLLGRCSDLYLTVVDRDVDGDAIFPPFESAFEFQGIVLREVDFEVRHYRAIEAQASAPVR